MYADPIKAGDQILEDQASQRRYEGKKIKEDFKIYVYPRGIQDIDDEVVIKGVKLYDISSSKIKDAIVEHIYDDLDPKVKEYIITHHLYQD